MQEPIVMVAFILQSVRETSNILEGGYSCGFIESTVGVACEVSF